jgi:hypothetical protein
VVTAYHPNPPGGPFTVYAQHASYFNSVGDNWCPRLAFLQDLERELQSFLLDGDQIVLSIDGNANMKNSDLKSSLESLTPREAILERHGTKGPSTYRRNNSKEPIDGIWITPGLNILEGGYFGLVTVFPNTDH